MPEKIEDLNCLFDACFRIQREACAAAGRHIPMVVENVKGAQPWVGCAKWHYGSFYLWGDVPALMPLTQHAKVPGISWSGFGQPGYVGQGFNTVADQRLRSETWVKEFGLHGEPDPHGKGPSQKQTGANPDGRGDGLKNARNWWSGGAGTLSATTSSKSSARKAASAAIAKIPFELSSHIGRVYHPGKQS